MLRLVAEVLREPSFPAEEFEQLRQEQLAASKSSGASRLRSPRSPSSATCRLSRRGDVRYVHDASTNRSPI